MSTHDEKWLDELYAEGATAAPPDELDARVLAAAKETARGSRYQPRVFGALATAAVLVLAVGVTLNLRNAPMPGESAPAPAATEMKQDVVMRDELRAAADSDDAVSSERSLSRERVAPLIEESQVTAAANPPPLQSATTRNDIQHDHIEQIEPIGQRPQAKLAKAERRFAAAQLAVQPAEYQIEPLAGGFLIGHPDCPQPVVLNGATAAATAPQGVLVTLGAAILEVACSETRWSVAAKHP